MSVFSDLLSAWPGLLLIAGGVGVLVWYGRDRQPDTYSVDDYRPDPDAVRAVMTGLTVEQVRRWLRPGVYTAAGYLPPAPPGVRVSLPLYAEQVVAELMRERYGTTSPAVIAGRFLRDIAANESIATNLAARASKESA